MAGMEAFRATDPEFMERWEHFAYEETHSAELDGATRQLAILAALIGCQGTEAFRLVLPAALDGGLTPVMAREVVYQAVDCRRRFSARSCSRPGRTGLSTVGWPPTASAIFIRAQGLICGRGS